MNTTQVIANYEALLALTGQMRVAAMDGEWDQLVEIEQQRGDLIAAIKPVDAELVLDMDTREQRDQMIHKILTDDAEIRTRVQAWMSQLQLSMQSNRQEQRLLQAYGA
jgi:flagellar protein FliT